MFSLIKHSFLEFNRSVKDTENNMTMDNNFLVENENQVILTGKCAYCVF